MTVNKDDKSIVNNDKDTTKRTPWVDPIVSEVRAIRDLHAKKFNYDLQEIFKDLVNQQEVLKSLGYKVISKL